MEANKSTSSVLDSGLCAELTLAANAIRSLAVDVVQRAGSGHPGLPMGCAELGAYLYGHYLTYCSSDSNWVARDRFILSAGHGSALQYVCLHLSGFDLSLSDLQRFRQLHSKTPGHPEAELTPGVETTTGPLGQGVGHAVGQALGLKLLQGRFSKTPPGFDAAKVIALAGDGCIMEGVSSESSSLAGHLQLNNLILIYDSNSVTLDGPLADSCSEDTELRYKSYGWQVERVDGHDLQDIHRVLAPLRAHQERPVLVIAKTQIGRGSPHRAGSHKVHGSPLGEEEVALVKKGLGFPPEPFYVPAETRKFFVERGVADRERYAKWQTDYETWKSADPDRYLLWQALKDRQIPNVEVQLQGLKIPSPISGRAASQAVIASLAAAMPSLYGGSADLSGSDMTLIRDSSIVERGKFSGRNLKFGVREFAMVTAAVGLGQTEMIFPFVGTFLTFSDYMRNGIRLAALMRCRMVLQFTHDSIFLGEDGPTHQPIEHLASLRAMPNLQVIRPADSNEVKGAWIAAMQHPGPTAIVLSRQNLPELSGTNRSYADGVGRGAYDLAHCNAIGDVALFATGSEVALAQEVADLLANEHQIGAKVISVPCWSLFFSQNPEYQNSLLGGARLKVSIEAGVSQGWHRFTGHMGLSIAIDSFGASAPIGDLQTHFGFTANSICERIRAALAENPYK